MVAMQMRDAHHVDVARRDSEAPHADESGRPTIDEKSAPFGAYMKRGLQPSTGSESVPAADDGQTHAEHLPAASRRHATCAAQRTPRELRLVQISIGKRLEKGLCSD
jgi:hypothetical protein